MNTAFKAIKITDKVFWVGAIDWAIRDFHGYSTPRGSTYNAYLILADKITLVDTVKRPFMDELLARVSSVIDPSKIDYIISNHSEMDHSGSLVEVINKVSPAKVFASKMGTKALFQHFGLVVDEVANGAELDLGNMTLNFLETRMIHWPDSMFTYIPEEKVLFSQDAFGMHLASAERFADELSPDILRRESDKYYANIVLPYSPVVKKTLEKVTEINLEIGHLCPDHGPIWRGKDIGEIIGWYSEYVAQKPRQKAVILYDTMWGSTEKMARSIADGLSETGADVKVLDVRASSRSEVITELLFAGAVIVGSPTLNQTFFPTLADVLNYSKGLKPQNLIGATFGSYGWSGEAAGQLQSILEEMGVEIVSQPLKINYVPTQEALTECRDFGLKIGIELKKAVENER
ncbi:MAG: FprA family A-type flavoprotein [bacterium]